MLRCRNCNGKTARNGRCVNCGTLMTKIGGKKFKTEVKYGR